MTNKKRLAEILDEVGELQSRMDGIPAEANIDKGVLQRVITSIREICETAGDDGEPDYFVCDGCHG